jgi:hypothetical protein
MNIKGGTFNYNDIRFEKSLVNEKNAGRERIQTPVKI